MMLCLMHHTYLKYTPLTVSTDRHAQRMPTITEQAFEIINGHFVIFDLI